MSGDMMPKQQYDFIKGIQDNMLEASNMTEDDAWRFGFLIWQHQEWICKYLIDRKTEPTISKMEQVDKDINVRSKDEPYIDIETGILHWCGWKYKRIYEDEPQTDCAWK